jgi:hypothetical protein
VFHHCFTIVSPLSHHCFTIVSPLFHHCFTIVSPLFHHCFTIVSPLFHHCFTIVSPLSHLYHCFHLVPNTFVLCTVHTDCILSTLYFFFFGSHLAARPERVRKRNGNYQQILEKLSLKMGQDFIVGKSGKRAPQLTHVFEHLFWLGDLNYRLDHIYSHAVNLVAKGDWEGLIVADQLKREMKRGRAFAEFQEGSLRTCPSYRWSRHGHAFSDKRGQSPSYTDRILWRSMPGLRSGKLYDRVLECIFGQFDFWTI